MFDLLNTIVGPNPDPWPFPKHEWTTKEILIAAILYLTLLILTRGVATGTAFAMASKKYNISEDVLRNAAKEQPWA